MYSPFLNLKFFLLAIATMCVFLTSCDSDKSEDPKAEVETYSTVKFEEEVLKREFLAAKDKMLENIGLENSTTFNNTEVFEVKGHGQSQKILLLNQDGLDKSSRSNYAITMVVDNQSKLGKAMIVKTEKVNENISKISYFNESNQLIFAVALDKAKEKMEFTNSPSTGATSGKCGQATADCMSDTYTQKGWFSVVAVVASAFLPSTAVGIAAGCAAKHCL